MKIKSINLLLIIALLVSLTACGQKRDGTAKPSSASAKEVIESMQKALRDVKQIDTDMKLELRVSTKDREQDFDLKANINLKGRFDPFGIHLKADDIKGFPPEDGNMDMEEIELYVVKDGEKYALYVYTNSFTQQFSWFKITQDTDGLLAGYDVDDIIKQIEEVVSLDETVELTDEFTSKIKMVDDGENYIISVSLRDIMDDLSSIFADVDAEVGLTMLDKKDAELECYVNKKTRLPSKLIIDMPANEEVDTKDSVTYKEDGLFEVTKGTFEMSLKFDKVSDIVVPEDVKSNAYMSGGDY